MMSGFFEFISVCFAPVNVPYTMALALIFLYWIMFVAGAVGLDALDIDVDVDADLDVDVDMDMDADVDVDADMNSDGSSVASGGIWISILKFFNVGDVPMMVLASVLVFTMWSLSVLGNYYFNSTGNGLIALICAVPNLMISALTTKVVTTPIRSVFRYANAGIEAPLRMVGKSCVVTTSEVTPKFGQAELVREGTPITLNVRSRDGETLKKGDEAVIAEHNKEMNTYLVIPFDLEEK